MAEDDAARPGTFDHATADAVALQGAHVLDPRAAAYLEEQTRLARLQAQNLEEQNIFELSHLRFRRFSDVARFALELSGALIAFLVVCGLGSMVWRAAQDRDLVVAAFSVPSDVAQSGMTGSVLAGRVLDRLGAMQAGTFSLAQGVGAYRRDSAEAVRIEIPTTGISLGELNNYLREWLGDETRIGGDLVHSARGYTFSVRYGDQPGRSFESGNLDRLITQAAEHLYRAARPLRYADYLGGQKRFAEAQAIIVPLAGKGSARERALAYLSWGLLRYHQGDPEGQMEKSVLATQLDPANAAAWYELSAGAFNAGHRELAFKAERTVLDLIHQNKASDLDPDMVATLPVTLAADRDIDDGDPGGATAACQGILATTDVVDCGNDSLADYAAVAHDIGEARRVAALIPASDGDGLPNSAVPIAQMTIALAAEDWPAAVLWGRRAEALLIARPDVAWRLRTQIWPQLAYALARQGDFATARAIIAKTSIACDTCLRMRGRIAEAEHRLGAADYWFARAAAVAPSLPYPETDWGRLTLRRGKPDGAIAKFAAAHAKGPHFADPLVGWGEALLSLRRADLAVARFADANPFAPNWGRLHLKWGEALLWSGHPAEAEQQFALARALFLTAGERAELGRVSHG